MRPARKRHDEHGRNGIFRYEPLARAAYTKRPGRTRNCEGDAMRRVVQAVWLSVVLVGSIFLPYSQSSALDHCYVPHGMTYTINEHSACRRVTNNHASGSDIFVPTKTAAEWSVGANAFINALPAGVSTSACSAGGITFRSSSTSKTPTIVMPANIQAGDILVFLDRAQSNSPNTPSNKVTPAGWTLLSVTDWNNTRQQRLYAKVAVSGDAGASITGMNGDFWEKKTVLVFAANATGFTPLSFSQGGSEGNISPKTTTSSAGTPPMIVLGAYSASARDISPIYFTPAADAFVHIPFSGSTNTGTTSLGYKIYNSGPPADVTIDMDDEGVNIMHVGYINVVSSGGSSTNCAP